MFICSVICELHFSFLIARVNFISCVVFVLEYILYVEVNRKMSVWGVCRVKVFGVKMSFVLNLHQLVVKIRLESIAEVFFRANEGGRL